MITVGGQSLKDAAAAAKRKSAAAAGDAQRAGRGSQAVGTVALSSKMFSGQKKDQRHSSLRAEGVIIKKQVSEAKQRA